MKLVHNRRSNEPQDPPRPPLTWQAWTFWITYTALVIALFTYACRRVSS